MQVSPTGMEGLILIEPRIFKDERGFFLETYQMPRYRETGLNIKLVQDNHSRSQKGVLRGLHYQINNPQGKIVRVIQGCVFDVAVDIRLKSSTFGHSYWTILDSKTHHQLFMPPGIAHGFCVVSDFADFEYKCTDYYNPENQGGILWNDPELNIPWPIKNPILSERDKNYSKLSDIPRNKLPES